MTAAAALTFVDAVLVTSVDLLLERDTLDSRLEFLDRHDPPRRGRHISLGGSGVLESDFAIELLSLEFLDGQD